MEQRVDTIETTDGPPGGFFSPTAKRRWRNFKANRRGYWSLWIFLVLFTLSLFAELIANDRPILASYKGELLVPVLVDYPEEKFGGFLARTELSAEKTGLRASHRQAGLQCRLHHRRETPVMRIAILATVIVAVLLLAGCEPKDRRPGTWLGGEEHAGPVTDWSFVNDVREVYLETRPWYGVPFSVTVVIASSNGKVFVPSIYEDEDEFPGSKYWNHVIADDPSVRVKVGDTLYRMNAYPAESEAEFQEGLAALADKYSFWQDVQGDNPNGIRHAIIRLHPAGE